MGLCETSNWGSLRLAVLFDGGVLVNARVAAAQQAAQDIPQPSTSLASQFFEHDFVNVFAFGTGLYDSGLPQLKSGGSGYAGSLGYDLGGGVTLAHNFQDGTFSFHTAAITGITKDLPTRTARTRIWRCYFLKG